MEKKQTAVEWLIEQINNVKPHQFCSIETIKEWCEQAKEMEKQQIIKTGLDCGSFIETEDMEQYYNETYKTE